MKKRTKLKDIAEELGISITTVSRAINNKDDINSATRRMVLETANKLDYRHASMASSETRGQLVDVVGVILPNVSHYFFSSVLQGIMSKAHLHNHLVLVGESLHSIQKEKKILDEFVEFGVKGILLAPCKESDFESNITPLLHRRIPVVIMDRSYDSYKGNFVLTDDFNAAVKAVNHLVENGYTRIAHIGSMDRKSVGMHRHMGYEKALRNAGLPVDDDLMVFEDISDTEAAVESGYRATKKLFEQDNPPDAIFTVTDDVAVGAYEFAKEVGLKIPDDLGVVGFSNSKISKYVTPGLTTVEQNALKMGELTFDYFHKAFLSSGEVFQKTFELQLIVRGSSIRN